MDNTPEALVAWMNASASKHRAYWRQLIEAIAQGDDAVRLKLVAAHIAILNEHLADMRDLRDEIAGVLRERGFPMTRIATLAQCSDSYLARRVFGKGGRRKFRRGMGDAIS